MRFSIPVTALITLLVNSGDSLATDLTAPVKSQVLDAATNFTCNEPFMIPAEYIDDQGNAFAMCFADPRFHRKNIIWYIQGMAGSFKAVGVARRQGGHEFIGSVIPIEQPADRSGMHAEPIDVTVRLDRSAGVISVNPRRSDGKLVNFIVRPTGFPSGSLKVPRSCGPFLRPLEADNVLAPLTGAGRKSHVCLIPGADGDAFISWGHYKHHRDHRDRIPLKDGHAHKFFSLGFVSDDRGVSIDICDPGNGDANRCEMSRLVGHTRKTFVVGTGADVPENVRREVIEDDGAELSDVGEEVAENRIKRHRRHHHARHRHAHEIRSEALIKRLEMIERNLDSILDRSDAEDFARAARHHRRHHHRHHHRHHRIEDEPVEELREAGREFADEVVDRPIERRREIADEIADRLAEEVRERVDEFVDRPIEEARASHHRYRGYRRYHHLHGYHHRHRYHHEHYHPHHPRHHHARFHDELTDNDVAEEVHRHRRRDRLDDLVDRPIEPDNDLIDGPIENRIENGIENRIEFAHHRRHNRHHRYHHRHHHKCPIHNVLRPLEPELDVPAAATIPPRVLHTPVIDPEIPRRINHRINRLHARLNRLDARFDRFESLISQRLVTFNRWLRRQRAFMEQHAREFVQYLARLKADVVYSPRQQQQNQNKKKRGFFRRLGRHLHKSKDDAKNDKNDNILSPIKKAVVDPAVSVTSGVTGSAVGLVKDTASTTGNILGNTASTTKNVFDDSLGTVNNVAVGTVNTVTDTTGKLVDPVVPARPVAPARAVAVSDRFDLNDDLLPPARASLANSDPLGPVGTTLPPPAVKRFDAVDDHDPIRAAIDYLN